jgi:hypothetical protein
MGYITHEDGKYNGNLLPSGAYYYIVNPNTGTAVISESLVIYPLYELTSVIFKLPYLSRYVS